MPGDHAKGGERVLGGSLGQHNDNVYDCFVSRPSKLTLPDARHSHRSGVTTNNAKNSCRSQTNTHTATFGREQEHERRMGIVEVKHVHFTWRGVISSPQRFTAAMFPATTGILAQLHLHHLPQSTESECWDSVYFNVGKTGGRGEDW